MRRLGATMCLALAPLLSDAAWSQEAASQEAASQAAAEPQEGAALGPLLPEEGLLESETWISLARRLLENLVDWIPRLFAAILVLVFFFLKDGDRMWSAVTSRLGRDAAPHVDEAGRRAWTSLGGFVRGTAVVAAAARILIGAAMGARAGRPDRPGGGSRRPGQQRDRTLARRLLEGRPRLPLQQLPESLSLAPH